MNAEKPNARKLNAANRRSGGARQVGSRKPAPLSRLLSAKAAAAHLGLPYASLRDLGLRGDIPIVRFGRRWFFRREDLDGLIERNTVFGDAEGSGRPAVRLPG